MSLFRKGITAVSGFKVRFLNRQIQSHDDGSNLMCFEKKASPKFDGIQFALHNDTLALTYVKERAITGNIQFYYNTMHTENHPMPIAYKKESIKLLVFHGIPLTSQLHDIVFNSNIDFHKLVDCFFKSGSSRGTTFIEHLKTTEHSFVPLKSLTYDAGFVYPWVHKYIKKCVDEPVIFAQEDRHFGVVHAGGFKQEQIEHSLKLLDIRIQRIYRPGHQEWICSHFVKNIYSNRTYHFTIKEE